MSQQSKRRKRNKLLFKQLSPKKDDFINGGQISITYKRTKKLVPKLFFGQKQTKEMINNQGLFNISKENSHINTLKLAKAKQNKNNSKKIFQVETENTSDVISEIQKREESVETCLLDEANFLENFDDFNEPNRDIKKQCLQNTQKIEQKYLPKETSLKTLNDFNQLPSLRNGSHTNVNSLLKTIQALQQELDEESQRNDELFNIAEQFQIDNQKLTSDCNQLEKEKETLEKTQAFYETQDIIKELKKDEDLIRNLEAQVSGYEEKTKELSQQLEDKTKELEEQLESKEKAYNLMHKDNVTLLTAVEQLKPLDEQNQVIKENNKKLIQENKMLNEEHQTLQNLNISLSKQLSFSVKSIEELKLKTVQQEVEIDKLYEKIRQQSADLKETIIQDYQSKTDISFFIQSTNKTNDEKQPKLSNEVQKENIKQFQIKQIPKENGIKIQETKLKPPLPPQRQTVLQQSESPPPPRKIVKKELQQGYNKCSSFVQKPLQNLQINSVAQNNKIQQNEMRLGNTQSVLTCSSKRQRMKNYYQQIKKQGKENQCQHPQQNNL